MKRAGCDRWRRPLNNFRSRRNADKTDPGALDTEVWWGCIAGSRKASRLPRFVSWRQLREIRRVYRAQYLQKLAEAAWPRPRVVYALCRSCHLTEHVSMCYSPVYCGVTTCFDDAGPGPPAGEMARTGHGSGEGPGGRASGRVRSRRFPSSLWSCLTKSLGLGRGEASRES